MMAGYGRPMKGRTRRVPLTVHAPLDTLEAIDEYVREQGGSFSRSDFYEEAAKRYLVAMGRIPDEDERGNNMETGAREERHTNR